MTLTDPTDVERLRALVAELDALLDPVVSPAAINADGSPGNVAPGELIESAWGNATANTIGKLKTAQRYQTALTLATATADVAGLWVGGNLAIPSAPFRRLATITATVLMTCTAETDLGLYGAGAVLMRKARRAATAGNGATLQVTSQQAIAANASEQYACKVLAVGGTTTVTLLGGSEFNYVDVLVVPTLTT